MLKNVKFIHVYKTSIYTSDSIAYFQLEKKRTIISQVKRQCNMATFKIDKSYIESFGSDLVPRDDRVRSLVGLPLETPPKGGQLSLTVIHQKNRV